MKRNRVKVNCRQCGASIERTPSKVRLTGNFCNFACHNRSMWLGKPRSAQHRAHLSAALKGNTNAKGRAVSAETREKLKRAQTGRIASEETCRRIGDSKRGPKNPRWKGGVRSTPDYMREYSRRFRERDRERRRHIRLAYLARRKGATGSHTLEEWLAVKAIHAHLCAGCGESEANAILCADHRIPLRKGGSDGIENIQPLCKPCNSRKGAKLLDDVWMEPTSASAATAVGR